MSRDLTCLAEEDSSELSELELYDDSDSDPLDSDDSELELLDRSRFLLETVEVVILRGESILRLGVIIPLSYRRSGGGDTALLS